jgi:hypothetical protein
VRIRKPNRKVRRDWSQRAEHGRVHHASPAVAKAKAAQDRYQGYRRSLA